MISSVSFSLAALANLENLFLSGSAAVNATGNSGANILRGNSAANILNGGAGNDTYLFGRGDGSDTIVDSDSTAGNIDRLCFDAGISHDQLWFSRVGNNLEVSVIGTGDRVSIRNWYLGAANRVEVFQIADGGSLLQGSVEQLVQAMAAMTPPAAGQTSLGAEQSQQLEAVFASAWQVV